ncbi:glycosyltransferase family 2 protein [Fibrella sp. USSR17]
MNEPLVSIIIPTYNRSHLIGKAIRSVQAQRYTNWQLIIIDDGSTDGLRAMLATYDCLEYYAQPNQGQAAARNRGLEFCRGEFITSLDSDDEWHPDFLSDGVAMLCKHQLDFVFMNWVTSKGEDGYTSYFAQHRKRYCTQLDTNWWLLNPKQNRRLFVETCPSPSSSLIIRRQSFPSGWNPQMRIADDWCMMLDMVMKQDCYSAFSPHHYWTKHIGDDNIWDCRDNTLVIPDVGFHDEQVLVQRFSHLLTARERRVFRRRMAIHHFHFAYFSWRQAVASSVTVCRHLAIAFGLSPTAVSQIVLTWGHEHVQKRWRRLSLVRKLAGVKGNRLAPVYSEIRPQNDHQIAQDEAAVQLQPAHTDSIESAAEPGGTG